MRARVPSALVPYRPLLEVGLRQMLLGEKLAAPVPVADLSLQRIRVNPTARECELLCAVESLRGDRQRNGIIIEALALGRESNLNPCPTDGTPCKALDCKSRSEECV